MVNRLTQYFSLTLFFILLCFNSGAYADKTPLTAKLDRTSITINESANLIIQADDAVELPVAVLQKLQQNFDVHRRGDNSQTSCMNFSCKSIVTVTYQLTPKHIGLFSIPAISAGNEKTRVLQLKVKAANNNPNSATVDPVFIETEIDKSEAYVQEQILLTFKINNSIELRDLSLEKEFLIEDAIVKLIDQKNYERSINGRRYNTAELHYAILAQKSGALQIPAINIMALVSKGGFRTQRMRLRSEPKRIEIKANPTGATQWLPAKFIKISESWSDDITQIQVGDSITRTITTTALGLAAEQLPPINIKANGMFKTYPDQAKLDDKSSEQGIIGERIDNIAIVAIKAGTITLPAITITWWNSRTQQQEVTTLDALELNIAANPYAQPVSPKPDAQVQSNSKPSADTATDTAINAKFALLNAEHNIALEDTQRHLRLWQMAFAASLIIAVIFALLYFRKPSVAIADAPSLANNAAGSADSAWKHLQQSCASQDATAVREALLAWARLKWPTQSINSAQDIAQRFKDTQLQQQINALDAALFGDKALTEDFTALSKRLQELTAMTEADSNKTTKLAALYPVQ